MKIRKIKVNDGTTKFEVKGSVGARHTHITRRFDTERAAKDFVLNHEIEAKVRRSGPGSSGRFEDTNFKIEAEYWLEHARVRFRRSHLVRVEGILKELLPLIGSMTPDRLSSPFLGSLQRKMKKSTFLKSEKSRNKIVYSGFTEDGTPTRKRVFAKRVHEPKVPSNATINRKLEVVTTILNFSAKHKRIPFSPCSNFSKLPDDGEEMHFWEMNEAESFLKFANEKYPPNSQDRWKYVVYLLALNCALRAGEMWGVQSRDIGLDTILIRRQFDRTLNDFSLLKSMGSKDSFRRVPCNAELRNELMLLVTKFNIQPNETVFLSEDRTPIGHDNFIKRTFAKDLNDWGGRKVRFHDLRHTATTLLIAAGFDVKTVQSICGHKNISTTMRYVHLVGDKISEVAKTFSVAPKDLTTTKLTLIKSEGV